MKKMIFILIYFLIFWVILPFMLITGANYLDENLFSDMILPGWCRITGIVVFIPGLLLMLSSVFQFRIYSKEFPVSATPPEIIIQKGLFSAWRHPIYLFAVITFTGLALILLSFGFLFIVLPVFIVSVLIYIRLEEKGLERRFGSAYKQYKARTGLLIPGLNHWIKVLVFPFFKILFGIKIYNRSNIPVSPPFFVVAGHRNYLDPFFISFALPWSIRYISTYEMFRNRFKRKIFSILGAIPKRRYASDTKSILLMMNALGQGSPVGVFPEGERSWTGKAQSLKPGTIQMFKKFKHIPVLPVRLEGNYYLWPRWSPRMLSSKVRISFEPVINVNEEISDEKLEEIIIERTGPRSSVEQSFYCRSKNITGNLSRLLYRCPVCHEKEVLFEIPPRTLKCKKCSQIIEIDRQFNLKYTSGTEILCRSIADLYNEIKIMPDDLDQPELTEIAATERSLPWIITALYRTSCRFYEEQNDAFVLIGNGMIYLTDKGIFIICNNKVTGIEFSKLGAVTIESYYRLQLYLPVEKQIYQVTLEKESVIKWQDTIVLLMEKAGLKEPVTR